MRIIVGYMSPPSRQMNSGSVVYLMDTIACYGQETQHMSAAVPALQPNGVCHTRHRLEVCVGMCKSIHQLQCGSMRTILLYIGKNEH